MNRWVGIVSLRETAAPTPVHRIALAIEAARRRTSYSLNGHEVSYARIRAALRRVGQDYAARSEWDRWSYCVDLAGRFFDGGEPPGGLPRWLTGDLRVALDRDGVPASRRTRRQKPEAGRPGSRRPEPMRRKKAAPARPVPARSSQASHRPRPESVEPYIRAVRQLACRDITYPALSEPPTALVGTFGETVRAAVEEAAGDWGPAPEAITWLGLAASHRSHLYESGLAETTVTPHVLGMLDRLGRSTVGVILIDAYTRVHRVEKVGTQSTEHNRRLTAARHALGQWAAEHGLVRMGAGEAQRPAPSVAESVASQILGTLSLVGAHDVARRLVEAVCTDLDRSAEDIGGTDPTTEAQIAFAKEDLTYDFTEEGPDHSKTFLAAARTRTGRSARGTGPNKKTARAAAARALLRAYPQYAGEPSGDHASGRGAARPAPAAQPYLTPPLGHKDAVADLKAMFELSGGRTDGLLAQALTHSSYVYENRAAATAVHQRDNQLLAHHGSLILDHLATHARVHRVLVHGLVPDEDEARIHTPANEDTAHLGDELALAQGLMTGLGAGRQRETMVADAAQAVTAAAWRIHGPRLLHRRPAALDDWLAGLQHRHDPVTVLNYMAGTFGMRYAFEHALTGPDHLQTYTSTLVLHDARGRVQRWSVPPGGPCSKTEADRTTAQDVLEILTAPGDDLIEALTGEERDLLVYLLRAQIEGLTEPSERQRSRMLSRGDLGTDLLATGDTEAFQAWAGRVQGLLASDDGAHVPDTLRDLYRKVVDDTRRGPRSLLRRTATDQGTDGPSTVRRNAADAVRRAAATGPWQKAVRDIVQDWWRDQAPDTGVTVRDLMRREDFEPLRVQLGALRQTLKWCGEAADAAGTPVDVELTVQDGTLHVWIGLHSIDVRAACDDFAQLLSRTLPYTDCLVDDDHVLLRLHSRPDPSTLTPLAAAGMDAYLGENGVRRPTEAVGAGSSLPDREK
ncbi:putative dsRNA-binding protein [Streptomyces sp. NBC_00151]|uniref:putative dsRNA-binding protein n=1 Tax=Streptomyces sp. NBC_00151 TaxID=2975669 RepID=UPI002DDA1DDC|nr:putative dsRNA-binding protein [Streptomyces sp. NBC_00151]WRZ39936.1 putative dsRNA-binding protein [Streptomyces sp. NBC_00151]